MKSSERFCYNPLMPQPETTEPPQLSIEQANQQILFVRQRIAVLGRNDSEFQRLSELGELLESGKLSPEEAVAGALQIEADKQSH